jgi:hypothetical protein
MDPGRVSDDSDASDLFPTAFSGLDRVFLPDRKGEQPLEVVVKACKDTRNLYAWHTMIKSLQDIIENKKMGRVMHSMALLQAGTRPSDLNLDEMVALKQIPREERISLMNARLLAKFKGMNVIEKETRDFGAEKPKSTLEEDLEWEMEADTSAWEEVVDNHLGGLSKLQMTKGEEKIAASRQARIKEETKAKLIHRRDVNTMEALRAEASDMTKASTAR